MKKATQAVLLIIAIIFLSTACNNQKKDNVNKNDKEVKDKHISITKPVAKIIDFNATWCGPCQQLKPIIEKAQKNYEGKIVFDKVDIDENRELAEQYNIEGIPTLIFLDSDGNEIARTVGYMNEEDLAEKINSLLK